MDVSAYKTRCIARGLSLQVSRVGSFNYVMIVQTVDPLCVVAAFNTAPYAGSLRDLYAHFVKVVNELPRNETGACIVAHAKRDGILTPELRAAIDTLKALLVRYDAVQNILPQVLARKQIALKQHLSEDEKEL